MARNKAEESEEKKDKAISVHITNNNQFQKGVGAFITNLNHLTLVMDSEGNMSMDIHDLPVMPHTKRDTLDREDVKGNTSHVSFDTLMEGVVHTQKLWWGSTGWAVVYAIYQKGGYKGSMEQFVANVQGYDFKGTNVYSCTLDSVQKPMARGRYIRDVAHWKEDGAKEREVMLGKALEKWLSGKTF